LNKKNIKIYDGVILRRDVVQSTGWLQTVWNSLTSPPSTVTQISQCVPHKIWYLANRLQGVTSPKTNVQPRVHHMSPTRCLLLW